MQCTVPLMTITPLAEDVAEFTFDISGSGFQYRPGQYVTVTLPALQGQPIPVKSHDFSIASSPHDITKLQIVARRSDSLFKSALFALTPGEKIRLTGPKGVMTLPETVREPLVCVAAGIGITPFLSMMRYAAGMQTTHRMDVYHCVPSPQAVLHAEELQRLAAHTPGLVVHMTYGRSGIRRLLLPAAGAADPQALWYLAGPPEMVTSLRSLLREGGIINNRIRWEGFTGYGSRLY